MRRVIDWKKLDPLLTVYRQRGWGWNWIGRKLGINPITARRRFNAIWQPRPAPPLEGAPEWNAERQRAFNVLRRDHLDPQHIAGSLGLTLEAVLERIEYMKRMGNAR